MFMVPTHAVSPTFPDSPMVSWEVPYDLLTEEEKTNAWFTNGSARHASTMLKWTAAELQPLSGTP